MDKLKEALKKPPSWLMRFVKATGRGINHYRMIADGDRVLLGISGGKDSLAMALALSMRRKWLPIKYSLEAVQIDWEEYPLPASYVEKACRYFDILEIPFRLIKSRLDPESFSRSFDCYQCSRNRKRILFDAAAEKDINKIALGHHLDDLVETTLINMIYRGSFATMMPKQLFFDGKMQIIRPMCEVHEEDTAKTALRLELPVVKISCPYETTNLRLKMEELTKVIKQMNRNARESIYRSHWNIQKDYLPLPEEEYRNKI